MESVGFKEWSLVCEALKTGEQSILLRKGGIAEGRDGFRFAHEEFFLFPTHFHEQMESVRGKRVLAPAADGVIEIELWARAERVVEILSCEKAEALAPFHILKQSVIEERFKYGKSAGLKVAFLRVYRLEPVWSFPSEPRFGGCRSWVKLPESLTFSSAPVLSEGEHNEHLRAFDEALGNG